MGLPLVVIVGADKGGVGKTMVSRALLDYFRSLGMNARAFDAEYPGGVLKRFFPAKAEVVDLTTSDGQMVVFDTLNQSPVTVIDLRAGLLSPMLKMLSETGFIDMVKNGKANIAILHVVGSSVASLSEVAALTSAMEGTRHFIVKNHANDAAFFAGIGSVQTDALKGAAVIEVPKLDDRAVEFVDAASLPFADFVDDEGQSLVMRGKVRHWLGQVFAALDVARFNR
jgi:hypothetical protein